MSQKVTTRKGVVNEEKEKTQRQTDSPVKDMKKKMAANAEKEKQAASNEKNAEKPAEKAPEKNTEKPVDKKADKPAEKKGDKPTDKKAETSTDKKVEKPTDKKVENPTDKKVDKPVEKKSETSAEKQKEDSSKGDKSGKTEKQDEKQKKTESNQRAKHNGNAEVFNGVSDVTLNANGVTDDALNGTVSADSDDDELLIIDDHQEDQDELFPELTYDDTSDAECFEPPTPENVPSRSFTRRSQAKSARTPETPRPASSRQPDGADDSKVLKMKDDSLATDRKLRSSDSPKPQDKKAQEKKTESPKKHDKEQDISKAQENEPKDGNDKSKDDKENEKTEKMDVEVVVEVEGVDEEPRKTDTNYSKSRVKVSPYRRSMRIADQTTSSVMANYTGNNTTMEMDITESSFVSEEPSLDDSSYLSGLRNIRGRRSYKPLKEMSLRSLTANRSVRSAAGVAVGEQPMRPTGTVVGRKRKPEGEEGEAAEGDGEREGVREGGGKRVRLLQRLAEPFRRSVASTPLPRRNADIVGINTDLPLTAPVASPDTFDPESLKTTVTTPELLSPVPTERDSKRCVVM